MQICTLDNVSMIISAVIRISSVFRPTKALIDGEVSSSPLQSDTLVESVRMRRVINKNQGSMAYRMRLGITTCCTSRFKGKENGKTIMRASISYTLFH